MSTNDHSRPVIVVGASLAGLMTGLALTRKGVELLPVIMSLKAWGDRHILGSESAVITDRTSGERVGVELRNESGRLVEPNEMAISPAQGT